MRSWRSATQSTLHRIGYELRRYEPRPETVIKLAELVTSLGVNHVIDVGANEGQFARDVRLAGFSGRIDSFEPVGATFEKLTAEMRDDSNWHGHRLALSDSTGDVEMKLYRWSTLASISDTTLTGSMVFDTFMEEDFGIVGTEVVPRRRLDDVGLPDLGTTLLKIDTQGHDWSVIHGAERTLGRVALLAMELSFVEMYETSVPVWTSLERLNSMGFALAYLDQAVCRGDDPLVIGEADGYFVRSRGFRR